MSTRPRISYFPFLLVGPWRLSVNLDMADGVNGKGSHQKDASVSRSKRLIYTRSPERRRHITSASRPRDANRKGTRKARQRWLGVGHFHGDFQAFRDANIFCEACGEFSVFHYVALEWR